MTQSAHVFQPEVCYLCISGLSRFVSLKRVGDILGKHDPCHPAVPEIPRCLNLVNGDPAVPELGGGNDRVVQRYPRKITIAKLAAGQAFTGKVKTFETGVPEFEVGKVSYSITPCGG